MRARRAGVWAIVVLAVAYAIPTPEVGWNQTAHYALVRALADGTPRIDRTRYETGNVPSGDIARVDGHYYAAKSPGLAFESLLPYLAWKGVDGAQPVKDPAGQLWYLNLWGGLLPAVILLLLVRRVTDRLEPGFGTAVAVTLGATTMILPFASLYFAHVLSTMLVFAAFAVLWHERRRRPSLTMAAAAGLLAGLGATVEFPIAVIGTILGIYAIARGSILRRAAAYAGGALVGSLPTLAYNRWAFGDPFEFSYANVVPSSGESTANKAGFFGVTAPKFHALMELLFARVGLLTLMPVLVLGAVGLVLLYRAGRRAEALVAGAIALTYLLLIASYETPFGGVTPGPRFLVATLPFLALGLAPAYRRFPLATAALAVCSGVEMTVISATQPLMATSGGWFHRLVSRELGGTSLELLGVPHIMPLFIVAVALSFVLAAFSVRRPEASPQAAATATLAVLGWIFLAARTPHLVGTNRPWEALGLVAAIAAIVVGLPQGLLTAWRFWQAAPAGRGR